MTLLQTHSYGNEKNPKKMIVVMHGYGSNGLDMLDIAEKICYGNKKIAEDYIFIAPNAPFAWEGDENFGGFQWFSLISRDEEFLLQGMQKASEILLYNIDIWLKKYSLSYENLVLAGFSQGAMLSMYNGIRITPQILGVLSFSGTFIGKDTIQSDIKSKPPICLIHGTDDEILPITYSKFAKKIFEDNDIASHLHIIPNLNHGINNHCIDIAIDFLLEK